MRQQATVIPFDLALRARASQMADELQAMQEALPNIPPARIDDHLTAMEAHAIELSKLITRISDNQKPKTRNRELPDPGPEAA